MIDRRKKHIVKYKSMIISFLGWGKRKRWLAIFIMVKKQMEKQNNLLQLLPLLVIMKRNKQHAPQYLYISGMSSDQFGELF